MKRLISLAFVLLAACSVARAFAETGSSPPANRISIAPLPAYAVSLTIGTDIADGATGRELWRVVFRPVLEAEIFLFDRISIGVSCPFAIEAGYPFHGMVSLDWAAGGARIDLGITGRRDALSVRGCAHFVVPGISGPAVGATVSAAAIRDPVALKLSLHAAVAPQLPGEGWDFAGGGCSIAVIAVLNDLISIELGTNTDVGKYNPVAPVRPSITARTGIYLQKQRFTASFFAQKELWYPVAPASVSAGVAFSWGTM
ncbi:MAG: hypothetical protein JW852_00465 [Spirochaetales bacterium]|nr:hypothetical protein [Spirochaetales bacterium]